MSQAEYYPDWKEKVAFAEEGPFPQILLQSDKAKVVLAGLEPGQKIPPHPEALAVFHFLEGEGWMIVDGERLRATPGTIVIAHQGAARGIEAETRLVFTAVRIA
ncbi:MAG: cupin domain-containing protein [Chloroflexi bacterium]|nr:cupin domain-containing protein [Chloroflexota bacterium]